MRRNPENALRPAVHYAAVTLPTTHGYCVPIMREILRNRVPTRVDTTERLMRAAPRSTAFIAVATLRASESESERARDDDVRERGRGDRRRERRSGLW